PSVATIGACGVLSPECLHLHVFGFGWLRHQIQSEAGISMGTPFLIYCCQRSGDFVDRPPTRGLKSLSHLKSTPLAARWPVAALSPGDRINYFDCDGQTAKDRARKR